MTVRERMLSLRLLKEQERDPAYMKKLGISVRIECQPSQEPQKERVQNA